MKKALNYLMTVWLLFTGVTAYGGESHVGKIQIDGKFVEHHKDKWRYKFKTAIGQFPVRTDSVSKEYLGKNVKIEANILEITYQISDADIKQYTNVISSGVAQGVSPGVGVEMKSETYKEGLLEIIKIENITP